MTFAFSVGFASYKPSRRDQKSIEQLMTEADQAMYVDKQTHHTSRTFQEKAIRSKEVASGQPLLRLH